jgi:histone-lysine N-methyltransferase SETD3
VLSRPYELLYQDYGDEMRGCHTKEDIYDDEVIIEVPLKCLITVEMGKETEVITVFVTQISAQYTSSVRLPLQIGQVIIKSRIELDAPKHIFLMIFMLVDRKNPNSFFKPYYDILPPTLNNMPIFWEPAELKYLTGSYLLEQIDERNVAIEADYLAICGVAPEFRQICTLQEFKWARMCVCSRNFGLTINGIQTAAMVPYADMLNHYRPRETKWQFDEERQGFTVVSLQNIPAGAQVYDSYGRKCNHRFLLNYGFSVENNVEADGFCPNEVR